MKKAFSLIALLLISCLGFAQDKTGEKSRKIHIIHADDLIFDDSKGDAKRLIGNVAFRQEQTYMYCDSAYFYSGSNSMDAFGHVKIVESDSVTIFSDFLNYNGDKKYAILRDNVKLIDKSMTLTTDQLDYDRKSGVAHYKNGGHIVDQKRGMDLTSEWGHYYPETKLFVFKDSVVLVTEDYTIYSDTLHYNNASNITHYFGPTNIYSDSTHIYCEKGWYDQDSAYSVFKQNAFIQSESQLLKGDSIRYDEKRDKGWMFCNVEVRDTLEDFIVRGDYGIHHKKDSTSLVTGHALLIQIFDDDSLFLHGDTLFSEYDSTREYRIIHAYRKVKFFKRDLSGKCDSLVFSDADSLIKMYYDPVIWAEGNQLTAEYVQIKNYDGKVRWMEMEENSFIITREDSVKFNQISGKDMMNHFKDGKLDRIEVFGNGKTIYYAKEDEEEQKGEKPKYIGVNEAASEDLFIQLDSNEVEKIMFLKKPEATLTPLKDVNVADMKLSGFVWRIKEKPRRPEEVFIWEIIEEENNQ